jgi:hypothetical protein
MPLLARDWLEVASVKHWSNRLSPKSFKTYYSFLYRFLMEVKKDPDTVLLWARELPKDSPDNYAVLNAIQDFVMGEQGGNRYKSKSLAYTALRSFFMHNRVFLPSDPCFQIRGTEPPTQRKITIENLREIIGLAVQPWRSMILVKWMGFLDSEGLMYVQQHCAESIVKAIKDDEKVCKLELPGRKSQRNESPFYTFIGHDALQSLKEYFEEPRYARGPPKPDEPIWTYGSKSHEHTPVNKSGFDRAWLRLLRRAKLIPKNNGDRSIRYGYNVHNTRDLAISLANMVEGFNPLCAEFYAGHTRRIDPLGYNQFWKVKPDYVMKQYLILEPHLNILTGPHTQHEQKVNNMQTQIDELRNILQDMQVASDVRLPNKPQG